MEEVYLLKYTKGISIGFWVGGEAKNLYRTQIEISNIFIGLTEEKKHECAIHFNWFLRF